MAKRFIDTGIFRKPLVRSMKAPYKALFIYLLCECDHAGVWDVELDVASTRLGIRLDETKAIEELCGSVEVVKPGKWYVRDFVAFQYGDLNPANRVHASVIARLESLNIDLKKEEPNKDLISPLQGAKDKDKDKELDKEKVLEKERARKVEAFTAACEQVTAAKPDRLLESERPKFIAYWTEANGKTGKMRFEAEDFFDHGRRMDTWMSNYRRNPPRPASSPNAPQDRNAPIETDLVTRRS